MNTNTTTIETKLLTKGPDAGMWFAWIVERPHVWALGKTEDEARRRLLGPAA